MCFWKNQKINSDLGERLFIKHFYTIFKDLLWDPPSHCNQAIKNQLCFGLIPSLSYFFLNLAIKYNRKNNKIK